MKLLNRLREWRDVQMAQTKHSVTPDEHSVYAFEYAQEYDANHLTTIGVGTTTVEDIIRLNAEYVNLPIHHYATA